MVGKQSQVATRILDLLDLNSFQSVVIGTVVVTRPTILGGFAVGVLLQDDAYHQVNRFEYVTTQNP